jgi:hypothetical protein
VAGESRVDESGGGVRQQSEPAERGLALEPGRDVVRERDELERAAEDELAGVQDERLQRGGLDQVRQLGLVLGRIDERLLVVVEEPEVAIQSHVHTRRLDHLGFPRLEPDASGVDLEADVAV